MRVRRAVLMLVALGGLAGCGSTYGTGGSGGGGMVGGGNGGGPVGSVTVGTGIQFVSGHNGSTNPAVDTIPVGGTVTWTWSGSLPHSVQSVGSASFASSSTLTGSGTYGVQFTTAGTYQYNCAVHGAAMTGTIVVR
jgi:plastocyanin